MKVSFANLKGKDVADVMSFIEKKSNDEITMLLLSLAVSEAVKIVIKKNWSYNENFDEIYVQLQCEAARLTEKKSEKEL